MGMTLSTCGFATDRFTVLRKSRTRTLQGGSKVTESAQDEVLDGFFVELPVTKEEFAGQIRLQRSGTLTLVDTVGLKPDDRIQDADGVIWEISAYAMRGENLKELVVKEAIHG